MLIALRLPQGNTRGPFYLEQVLAALHAAGVPLTLLVGTLEGQATLACRFAAKHQAVVLAQLSAAYPELRIDALADEALRSPNGAAVETVHVSLAYHVLPLRTHPSFTDTLGRVLADPIASILSAIAAGPAGAYRVVTLAIRPATKRERRRSKTALNRLAHPWLRRHPGLARQYLDMAFHPSPLCRCLAGGMTWMLRRGRALPTELADASSKVQGDLFVATLDLSIAVAGLSEEQRLLELQALASPLAAFAGPTLGGSRAVFRTGRRPRPFLLSAAEIASLWHPPTLSVEVPALARVESRLLPPPTTLPTSDQDGDLAVLGTTRLHRLRRFGLRPDDRFRHLLILGKSGMGKTTVLQQLIASDIARGRGVTLLDPHGDLADHVLAQIPRERTNDVIAFDAGDQAHALAFNPLWCQRPEEKPLVASGVVTAFKKMFGYSWGPRLEYWLRNAVLAMIELPDATLLSLTRFLSDASVRRQVLDRVADPIIRNAWIKEFAAMPAKLQVEALSPILNKIGTYVASPQLRRIVGQPDAKLDLEDVLDKGKVLIVNLSKGRLGEDASNLLGSLLVTSLQIAVMRRASVPEAKRVPHFLYIDEFQNVATESFATILSEARKYRLAFTGANQFLAQLDEATRSAVFGNVGSLVVFGVGVEDAELLAKQLGAPVSEQDLLACPKFRAFVRLLIDGQPSQPFSMRTISPRRNNVDLARAAIIRRVSARRFGRPTADVEREIEAALA